MPGAHLPAKYLCLLLAVQRKGKRGGKSSAKAQKAQGGAKVLAKAQGGAKGGATGDATGAKAAAAYAAVTSKGEEALQIKSKGKISRRSLANSDNGLSKEKG
jgi:hypothetical protein